MWQSALFSLALDAFVPTLAPVVVMAFLGTGLLLVCLALGAGVALAARRRRIAAALGMAAVGVAALYAAALGGAAMVSRERTLTPGEHKYFCEIDCHIAYDIVATAPAGEGKRAVTVRTWFDPATIASFRGDAPLAPGPRDVFLVDESGRRYLPSPEATESWQQAHGDSTPFGRELRPGESYRTTFVFDVPSGARSPRLFVGDPRGGLDRLVIGHENSPFHGKTYFALPAAAVSR
jgi:hypothetical protein